MNKKVSQYILAGVLVGIFITPFIFRAFWWPSVEDIAYKVADRLSIEVPTSTPIVENYKPGYWQKISAEGGLSTVGVGVGGKVYTGIVLSADGLIVTVADIIPSSGQVKIYSGDVEYVAEVVYRDLVNHVAILKTDAKDLIASPLNTMAPIQPGIDLVLVGKSGDSKNIFTYVKRAVISSIQSEIAYLDMVATQDVSGLKVVNEQENVLGMAYYKSGRVSLVSAETITRALNIYLESDRN